MLMWLILAPDMVINATLNIVTMWVGSIWQTSAVYNVLFCFNGTNWEMQMDILSWLKPTYKSSYIDGGKIDAMI